MVAITVLLAAVVGVFVLGNDPGKPMPQSELDATENSTENMVYLQIRVGESIDTSNLKAIKGKDMNGDPSIENKGKTLEAGQSIKVSVPSAAEAGNILIIRWKGQSGNTKILHEHKLSASWS